MDYTQRGAKSAPCRWSDSITSTDETREDFMRTRLLFGVVLVAAICLVAAPDSPITSNPIPEPIIKHGLAVEIKDLGRLPDSRGFRPADQDIAPDAWARVSYVRD